MQPLTGRTLELSNQLPLRVQNTHLEFGLPSVISIRSLPSSSTPSSLPPRRCARILSVTRGGRVCFQIISDNRSVIRVVGNESLLTQELVIRVNAMLKSHGWFGLK